MPANAAAPIRFTADSVAATEEFGSQLAKQLKAGDLIILDGPLGSGKTALARGIGAGLGVRGPITSPTFVIARVHPPLAGGPPMVHVDAYRLENAEDIDALDLDASVEDAVTVVEWGSGRAEQLAESWLSIQFELDLTNDQCRNLWITPHGPAWTDRSGSLSRLMDRLI